MYTNTPCGYYVFCKQQVKGETGVHLFPVAYTDHEQTMMAYECASRLTENVTDIHDTLKTYILKTCLFVLHQRLPDPTVELLPEQWALLIYEQLMEFLKLGHLKIPFNIMRNDAPTALFHCEHDLDTMLEHDELRAACCDQRINLLNIAQHLHSILHRHCQQKRISVDHIFRNLPRYDHNAGLVC